MTFLYTILVQFSSRRSAGHLNIQENPLYFEIDPHNFSNAATFTVDTDDDKAPLARNMVGDHHTDMDTMPRARVRPSQPTPSSSAMKYSKDMDEFAEM